MEITCIMCPVGCTLNVEKNNNEVKVTGNNCPRGEEYGKKEVTTPERMVTTVKKYKNGTISLKLSCPIKKELVDKCLKEINNQTEPKNIKVGDIFIKNVCKTKCDVVVTNINL